MCQPVQWHGITVEGPTSPQKVTVRWDLYIDEIRKFIGNFAVEYRSQTTLWMTRIAGWNGVEIQVATSAGGVLAAVNPWDNLVRTGVTPWPPPELIQKLYQSRQARAFRDAELQAATSTLGFYSDLQSLRSEDAITWSVFGPLAYAEQPIRRRFAKALLEQIGVEPGQIDSVTIWLWRRLPHPDTLVPGGPEIDFGIQSDDVFLLGEAKWLSGVGAKQGKLQDKDQVTLRREFCSLYGRKLLPSVKRFVVLGVSPDGGMVERIDASTNGVTLHLRDTTWEALCKLPQHPLSEELQKYLKWKWSHSGAPEKGLRRRVNLAPHGGQ